MFRVAGLYAVVSWLLAQMAVVLEGALYLPAWFDTMVVSLLLIGFPIAMVFAWAFEVTPNGIARTVNAVDGEVKPASKSQFLDYAIFVALVLIIGLLTWRTIFTASLEGKSPNEIVIAGDRPGDSTLVEPLRSTSAPTDNEVDLGSVPPASIAVLPFIDLSAERDQEYFSDGIAEEILNVLARVDGLKVASRTSSFQFKKRGDFGVSEIAGMIGVSHILEGSVRKAGDMVRVSVQLVQAQTDQQLWAATFDRSLSVANLFAIQDEIAIEVVSTLGAKMSLGTPSAHKFSAAADTTNLRAYDLYLESRELFSKRGPHTIATLISNLEEVVRLDPQFARGFELLAAALSTARGIGYGDDTTPIKAAQAAETALALEPALPLAAGVLGNLLIDPYGEVDYAGAIAYYSRAIAADPIEPLPWSWRGQLYSDLGYFEQAERDLKKSLELDPLDHIASGWLVGTLLHQNKIPEAVEVFEKVPAHFLNFYLVSSLTRDGEIEKAREILTTPINGMPRNAEADYDLVMSAFLNDGIDFDRDYPAFRAHMAELVGDLVSAPVFERDWLFAFKQYDALEGLVNIGPTLVWNKTHGDFLTSPHRYRLARESALETYWLEHGFPPQCRMIEPHLDGRNYECD